MPSRFRAGRHAVVLALPFVAAALRAQDAPVASVAVASAPVATGSVEGRVRIGRALTVRRARFRVYAEPTSAAAPVAPRESQVANVVMYLEGVPRPAGPVGTAHTMEQRGERFLPHVLPVTAGSEVRFPNSDGIYHNVFSLSGARTFDLGRYPPGTSKSVTFGRPGIVQVFCHIHSDMSAIVLVLDSPAYAVPDADGRFVIRGVPPGEYTLVAWHERAAPIRRRVRVSAGGTVVEDVDIPIVDEDVRRE